MGWDFEPSNESKECITRQSSLGSNKSGCCCPMPMHLTPSPKSENSTNSKPLSARKKQNLVVDSRQSLRARHPRMGDWRPQCKDICTLMAARHAVELLLLCQRWQSRLSAVYPRCGSHCQQNLYDSSRRRKHPLETLPRSIAAQDALLFQVDRNVGAFSPATDSLSQILGCAGSRMIHLLIQQRHFSDPKNYDEMKLTLKMSRE